MPKSNSPKYTFTMNHYDGTVTTVSGNKESIDDILYDFQSFLLGATYPEALVNKIQYLDEEQSNG